MQDLDEPVTTLDLPTSTRLDDEDEPARRARARRRREAAAASPARHEASPWLAITDTLQRFRAALAEVGAAPGLSLVTLPSRTGLRCTTCMEAAARRLELEPTWMLEPPEAVLAYQELSWWTGGPAPDDPEPGRRTRFFLPTPRGLLRLARRAGPECLWLGVIEMTEGHERREELLVATPSLDDVRALVTEVEREHREHDRRAAGVVQIARCGARGPLKLARVPWSDVLLPAAVRDDLERTTREFFASAHLYRAHRVPHRRGVLLCGPPGNGKTTIVRAMHTATGAPLVVVGRGDDGAVELRRAFDRASDLAPSILVLEDLDALVEGPRLAQFLNLLDGLEPVEGVLVVATTNRPDAIDPAIARRPSRFDRVFLIPEPDEPLRLEYLRRGLGDDVDAAAQADLAARTSGYSVAFLKELLLQARLAAIREARERLSAGDLDAALASTSEHLRLAARGLEARGLGFLEPARA